MDWNEDLAALVMEAWNEGVSGNEQLFDENSLEDTVRGYFVEPLRNRFANDGFIPISYAMAKQPVIFSL